MLDQLAIGLALAGVEFNFGGDLVEGKLSLAIIAQQTDGVGPALLAVAHKLNVAIETVLKCLQFERLRATLTRKTVISTMRRLGNQGHHIVHECAAVSDPSVNFDEVRVIDAWNHNRIDFGEDAALGQQFQTQHLALVKDPGSCYASVSTMSVNYPWIDLRPYLRIHHVDSDRHVIDIHVS